MIKLADVEPEIVAALKRLRELPEKHKPFVIVEDTVTQKFVQFAGSDARPILLDLPTNELTARARSVAATMLSLKPTGDPANPAYQADCQTPEWAARLAMRVLREVHDLPDIAELRIIEETTEPRHGRN